MTSIGVHESTQLQKGSEELIGTAFRGIAIAFKLEAMNIDPKAIIDIKEYIVSII